MKMLPIAIVGLFVSLLFQCGAEAQFRYGRFGGGGIRINIPLGGYGGFGYGYSGYAHHHFGHGFDAYGPYVGVPIYPVPTYRVPAYRVPIYAPYPPQFQTFSFRVEPSRRFVAPSRTYVYPQPSIDRLDEYESHDADDLGQVYGNYRSARPVAPMEVPDDGRHRLREDAIGDSIVDEKMLLRSAGVLRESLSRRSDDADIWLDYLNPDLIIDTVQSGGDGLSLQELLKNYDGLSGNSDLSDLWVAPGFRRTHQGLRAYVEDAANRAEAQSSTELDIQPSTELETPPGTEPNVAPVAAPVPDPQPEAEQELPAPI